MLDFPKRAVREPIPDEKFRYGFEIAPELVRTVLRDDEPDWVNTIFLSTRFKAWRVGGYNEYLYTFFKCLTDERIAYADGWFAEAHDDSASITLDGWEIQRRCPHLKADLSKFGVVEGTTLTCNLHGWQWNLTNGRCLTSKGHELRASKRVSAPPQLRRRPDPAGSAGDHVAPLPLSVGHVEGHPAAGGPRLPGRVRSACSCNRFRIWGSSDLRRWLPLDVWRPIKSTLVTLDVPGTVPESGVHPVARRRSSSTLLDELLQRLVHAARRIRRLQQALHLTHRRAALATAAAR